MSSQMETRLLTSSAILDEKGTYTSSHLQGVRSERYQGEFAPSCCVSGNIGGRRQSENGWSGRVLLQK
jgi:hypothetical protein